MGQHDGREGCLWTYCSSPPTFLERENHTVARLLETVSWVMVGGVNVDNVAEFLQSKSCVDYKAFGSSYKYSLQPIPWAKYCQRTPTNSEIRVDECYAQFLGHHCGPVTSERQTARAVLLFPSQSSG